MSTKETRIADLETLAKAWPGNVGENIEDQVHYMVFDWCMTTDGTDGVAKLCVFLEAALGAFLNEE